MCVVVSSHINHSSMDLNLYKFIKWQKLYNYSPSSYFSAIEKAIDQECRSCCTDYKLFVDSVMSTSIIPP